MEDLRLYVFGRSVVKETWNLSQSRIVNRLYYVNSGSAVISNGFTETNLVAGKIYIIPQRHIYKPVHIDKFDHTYFNFYYSHILHYDKIIELDANSLSMTPLFDYINSLIAKDNGESTRNALKHFLVAILSVIENTYDYSLPYITNSAVTQAVNLIHSDCSAFTTKLLAQQLNLDESYFIRLFSSVMGISPMKYIRACRVSYGKELMQNGASVAEAAEKCGYSSPSAFYNAYKSELKTSPSNAKKDNL